MNSAEWDLVDLGQRPDAVIAAELGVTANAVKQARRRKGISGPGQRKLIDWSTVTDLGRVPDSEIARRYGMTKQGVYLVRRRLGIPALGVRKYHVDWDSVGLGERPDSVIAEQYQVSIKLVSWTRRTRMIPSFVPEQINWNGIDLGKRLDTVIAKELGVSSSTVGKYRRQRGIPTLSHRGTAPSDDVLMSIGLGERPDSAIAEELGLSVGYVGKKRTELGIPSFTGFYLLQDGTPCRSAYEAMYDAVLHHHQVEHQHEVNFPELSVVADLVVEGRVTEIAGMVGHWRYDRRHAVKREIYAAAGVDVHWLSRADVEKAYATVPLRMKTRSPRVCIDCGNPSHRFVHGRCRHCYGVFYRQVEKRAA